MTVYLYATKNKKSGDFGKISTELYTKEQMVELYTNSAKEAPEQQRLLMEELDVYCLGSLDSKTGVIESEVSFLLDLGSVIHGE